jgi:hypothetical protein
MRKLARREQNVLADYSLGLLFDCQDGGTKFLQEFVNI